MAHPLTRRLPSGELAVGLPSLTLVVVDGPDRTQRARFEGRTLRVGTAPDNDLVLTDPTASRHHLELLSEGDRVLIRDLSSTNGTFVNGEAVRRQLLADGDKIQVGTTTILKFSYHDELDSEFQRKMYDAALRDGLTGAYNKKYFSERLDAEVAYSVRHRSALSLVLFDLDHFKNVNDNYGHLAGDYVLKEQAQLVKSRLRPDDVLGRYGGEEFAVLCESTPPEGAVRTAERIREAVEQIAILDDGHMLRVTVTSGVAQLDEEETVDAACARADDARANKTNKTGLDRAVWFWKTPRNHPPTHVARTFGGTH